MKKTVQRLNLWVLETRINHREYRENIARLVAL